MKKQIKYQAKLMSYDNNEYNGYYAYTVFENGNLQAIKILKPAVERYLARAFKK